MRIVPPLHGASRANVPEIIGNPRIGHTLIAVGQSLLGYWRDGTVTSWQWLRSGVPIDGATSETYLVTVADETALLSVRQRDTRGLMFREAASAETAAVGQPYAGTIPAAWTYVGGVLTGTAASATANLEVIVAPGVQYTVAFDCDRTAGTLYVSLDAGSTSVNTATSGAKSFTLAASTHGRLWLYGGAFSGTISNLTVTPVDAGTLLPPGPYQLHSPEIGKLSGPLLDNHTLGNLVCGGSPQRRPLLYFRATENAVVESARIFYTTTGDGGGYGNGNGGVIRMRIWPVSGDGFTPDETGSHLGESVYTPGLVNGLFVGGMTEHELHTFSGGSPLTKGQKYVVSCENISATKSTDWISVDLFCYTREARRDWVADGDWGSGYQDRASDAIAWADGTAINRGSWDQPNTIWAPCMEIIYAGGARFGIASLITGNVDNRAFVCEAYQPARAELSLPAPRVLRGAYLYVSAREGERFAWCLKHPATRVIASGIASAEFNEYDRIFALNMYRQRRLALDFGRPVRIDSALTCWLEIRPIGGTRLVMATNHDGRRHGYAHRFAVHEHKAQRWNAATSAWWDANAQQPPVNSNQAAWPLILVEA